MDKEETTKIYEFKSDVKYKADNSIDYMKEYHS